MAQLTWRDVAAPDFRSSMEGMNQFSQLLNGALGAARQGLSTWDGAKTDAVNTALQLELAKIQDPEAAKAFVETNLEGIDPRRIQADTLQAINNRPGQLIDLMTAEGNLDWTNYVRDRTKDNDGRVDAARPLLNQAMAATLRGDEKTAQDLLARPEVAGLNSDEFFKAISNNLGISGTKLDHEGKVISNDTGRENLKQSRTTHAWAVQDRADQQAGMAAAQMALQSAIGAEDIENFLSNQRLSPGAFQFALGTLATRYPDVYGSKMPGTGGGDIDLSGGTGGPGGVDPTRVMNYEARASGFNAVPENVRTFGQASDFALQVNAANKRRTGENGSSAMGLYQIVGTTMRGYAEKLWGKDWRNVEFNPQNQDKLAKAIFDDHKGSAEALRKQWVSLTAQEAEQIRKLPWEQARQVIARKESGGNPQALFAQARERSGQVSGNAAPNTFVSLQGNEMADIDVVDQLRAGQFKNVPKDFLLTQLRDIVKRGTVNGVETINFAQAGEILKRSLNPQQSGFERALSFGFGQKNLGNGLRLNDRLIDTAIQEAKAGGFTDRVVEQDNIAATAAQVAAAQAAFDNAAAQLAAAQRQKITRPGIDLSRYEAQYRAAQINLEIAKEAAGPATRPARQGVAPFQRQAAPKSGGNLLDPKTWSDMFTVRK